MTTTAARLWLTVAGLAFVAFIAYELASSGEWFGSFLLGTFVLAAGLLGVFAVMVRDGEVAGDDAAPVVSARNSLGAPWPALAAAAVGVVMVGAAGRNGLLWVGVGILAIVFIEWMVQGWAERATADPEYNRALRHRVMSPVEVPMLALLVIVMFLFSLSRVFLALPANGSTAIASVVAIAVLAVGALLAARPRIGSSVLAALLAIGAVALIGAGIAGGVAGERHIEKHEAKGAAKPTTNPTAGSTSTSAVTQPGSESNSTPASTP